MAEKPITDLSAYPEFKRVLLDFVVMSENEIRRIHTGYAPGPAMRDCLGQWQYLVAEAKLLIARDVIETK